MSAAHAWEAIESVTNKVSRDESITMREEHGRPATGQDRLLHALCRPERLMEIFRMLGAILPDWKARKDRMEQTEV